MIRRLRALITLAACIAAAGFFGSWVYYRANHVLAAYAFVKGAVVQIGAPVEGQITSVEVWPGERVEEGAVLVRLNDTRQHAELMRAQAGLEQAVIQVEVERETVGVLYQRAHVMSEQSRAKIAMNRAEARVAQIDAELALLQASRSSALRARDMVPRAQDDVVAAASNAANGKVDRARGGVAMAEAQLGNADVQLASAKARETRLQLLEAAVHTARAAVEAAQAELDLTLVRAARKGIVSRRIVEPGAAVRVGGALLEMWYEEGLSVEAWIDESKYADLVVGAPAEVKLAGLERAEFKGRVDWLGVVTDFELKNASFSIPVAKMLAQSRWVRARIVLDRADPRLLPGLTAEVSIPRIAPGTLALSREWGHASAHPATDPASSVQPAQLDAIDTLRREAADPDSADAEWLAALTPMPSAAHAQAPAPPASGSETIAFDTASACSKAGDDACVIQVLSDSAHTPRELQLLIKAYRSTGRTRSAQRVMQRYVTTYPSEAGAEHYRELLAAEPK